MARRERMNEDTLAALVDGQIADARQYARSDLAPDRDKALEYMRGIVDLQSEEGKSSVTSRDLSDVLNWIMPGLLRVFLASDRVVLYEPNKPIMGPDGTDISDERAKQVTDGVNYVFLNDCAGYLVLLAAFYDGLLLGNGIIKHWWDRTPEYKVQSFSGLSDAAYNYLVQHEDVEKVLEHTAYPEHNGVEPGLGMVGPDVPSDTVLAPPDAGGPALAAGVGAPGAGAAALPAGDGLAAPGMGGGQLDGATAGVAGAVGGGPQLAGADDPRVLAPWPGLLHDCKIKRRVNKGRLRVAALPPEQFLIGRDETVLDETTGFCAHTYDETRSKLIERGFDRQKIEDLGAGSNDFEEEGTRQSRNDSAWPSRLNDGRDKSTELVEVHECYVLCDYDGDGVAERRKVVMAGGTGQRNILSNEEWDDDLPFSDLVPEPIPHQWKGHSLYNELRDIVRTKTVLQRQTLDNLYQVNNPMNAVLDGSVLNMDQLINRTLGGNVFVKQAGAITPLPVEFTAAQSFQMLEYWDRVIERRGFSTGSGGLDPETLQNQTATAANIAQAVAFQRPEFYARNMAEVGLKRLFKCLLRLITAHQDRPRTIRLRGQWVEMDPRAWDADMDVSVNTGLGSGSRDRDLAMLQGVTAKMELILQTLGPNNPIVDLEKYRNALAKMTEAAGLRGPEQFFSEVTQEKLQQFVQAQAQQPDPKAQEAQARMQLDTAKAQHDAQLKQQQAIADFQHKQQESQAKLQHDREKFEAEHQMQRDKLAAELQAQAQKHALELELMREKAAQEAQLKREELVLEAQLKREQMAIDARQAQATNIREAEPQ